MPNVKGFKTRKCVAHTTIGIDVRVEESRGERQPGCFSSAIAELGRAVQYSPPRVTGVSSLPDDVLLEIFKSYMDQIHHEDAWYKLVHVCRKWRSVVFSSPHWLRLELRCTSRRPVKGMLGIWPAALPIVIVSSTDPCGPGVTNVIAALIRHDRVRRINVWGVPNLLLESAAIIPAVDRSDTSLK